MKEEVVEYSIPIQAPATNLSSQPQSGNASITAKWFKEHQDINAGKILDGLLGLKTEFPDESSNPGSTDTFQHHHVNLTKKLVPSKIVAIKSLKPVVYTSTMVRKCLFSSNIGKPSPWLMPISVLRGNFSSNA